MRIEEVESRIGQEVSVLQGGQVVARGVLQRFSVISAPTAPSGEEGWKVDQLLVLDIDGQSHRVSFDAKLEPDAALQD